MVTVQAPYGWQPRYTTMHATSRVGSTITRGDVVMLVFDGTHTTNDEVISFVIGREDSYFANVRSPNTGGVASSNYHGFAAIALETVEDDTLGRFCTRGVVLARVEGSDATAKGEPAFLNTGNLELTTTLPNALATGGKVVAITLETTASGTEANCMVLFNGIEGFGHSGLDTDT